MRSVLSNCLRQLLLVVMAGLSAGNVRAAPPAAGVTPPVFFVAAPGEPDKEPAYFTTTANLRAGFHKSGADFVRHGQAVRLEFVGANPAVALTGESRLQGHVNFLMGSDPRAWRTNLPAFAGVRYRDLYPGIDLVYAGAGQSLKSEFILAPGADPSAIRMRYPGARAVRLEGEELLVVAAGGELRERAPVLYQDMDGRRVTVAGGYRLDEDGSAGFDVGAYDRSRPLHIDPELQFSTFLGGNSLDYATALAVDGSGRVTVAGWTDSATFPVLNPLQNRGGGVDVFLVRYNAASTAIEYATYLGGSGDDRAYGLAVDGSGNAVLTGYTTSSNFPVLAAGQGRLAGGKDAFVLKLNETGSALVFSTYLGGSGQDEGKSVAVDAAGAIYVGGGTYSSNFPTLSAFQTMNAGGQDGFIAKFSSGGGRLYSTLLGGQADDRVNGLAVDSLGQAYVTGGTASTNLPVSMGAAQTALGGGTDAFVAKLGASGSQIVYCTYLGGNTGTTDEGMAIAVDGGGYAYVVGSTNSTNFPRVNAYQNTHQGGTMDAFLTKVSPSGNAFVFSTYVGGNGADYGLAIVLDANGNPYIAGQTTSLNFPTLDPLQATNAGVQDAFIARFNSSGSTLLWGSYLGGSQADGATAIGIDGSGRIHVAGVTQSANFPRQNPLQASHAGALDSFVARILDYVPAAPQAVSVSPSSGSGTAQTFRFTWSDANWYQEMRWVFALFHTQLSQAGACYLQYNHDQNTLWLRDDAGAAWLGPVSLGATATLQNSQCSVAAASSTASGSGTTLTLDVALTFKGEFAGTKNIYMYAADTSGLNSGWQTRGSWSVSGFAPEAVSVTPSSGSGTSQTFLFTYRDADGYAQLKWNYVLFNTSVLQSNACYVQYIQSDNTLYLRNDAGTSWLGPVALGGTTSLENSYCLLNAQASSRSASGVTLDLSLALTFKPVFVGTKNIYMYTADTTGRNSGWQTRGSWTISGSPPEAVSVSPSSGTGHTQTFRFTFSDPDGYQQLTWTYGLFHTQVSQSNACYVQYKLTDNTLWLRTDAGTAWLGPAAAGSASTLENSQCRLNAQGSAAAGSGTALTLDLALVFKPAFAGAKKTYLYAVDASALNSGWQQKGTWTVGGFPPEAVSVSPSSSSGSTQTFRFTFSDADGFAQLGWTFALFQTQLVQSNACYVQFKRSDRTLWLRDDPGGAWLGPVNIGQTGSLENSQCTLNAQASAVAESGTTQLLDLAIAFKPAFAGARNIYLYAADTTGLNSGWQTRGAWTVP